MSHSRGFARVTLVALGASIVFAARATNAQPDPTPRVEAPPLRSLRSRFGVDSVRPFLRAESTALRQRAFERLGTLGTSSALELLAGALAGGGEARDARERLVVVRALAENAAEESAVVALVRALGGGAQQDDPKEELVEQTAALALARSKNPRATTALFQALRQPGRVSANARLALSAYPPRSVQGLLTAPGSPTLALVELLGELGDAHASDFLSGLVRTGAPALRGPALLALAAFDRERALTFARAVARSEPRSELGVASIRLLLRASAEEAPALLLLLFSAPEFRTRALALALEAPSPALGELLARVEPEAGELEPLAAALGRAGGPAALAKLERWLADPERGWAAAYALALADNGEAPLERALDRPATRRTAVLASALSAAARGNAPRGLNDALDALAGSKLGSDRAAAGFGRALVEPERSDQRLRSADPAVRSAIARAGLHPEVARALATQLAQQKDAASKNAFAICLALPDAADLVPTAELIALVEGHGAALYLAAHALAARDGDSLRPRLRELLESADPLLRAHVALGLARSSESSAVGLLAFAYRFEPEARVRRAIVHALAARSEPGRAATLRLARNLDPDAETRRAAAAALDRNGARRPPPALATAWLKLTPPRPNSPQPLALVATSNGLALPAAADPDGSLTLVFLPRGPVRVSFAHAGQL